jgi:hypothetical protein
LIITNLRSNLKGILFKIYIILLSMNLLLICSLIISSIVMSVIGIIVMAVFFPRIYDWIVGKLFFIDWEDRGNIIKITSILRSNLFAMNLLRRRNRLENVNGFPLPYYYSHNANARTSLAIFLKQITSASQKLTPDI